MITIETIATVTSDGTVTIQLPSNVLPGSHKVVLVLDEQPTIQTPLSEDEEAWERLEELIGECGVDTGIPDLAHQHDHYLQ